LARPFCGKECGRRRITKIAERMEFTEPAIRHFSEGDSKGVTRVARMRSSFTAEGAEER
jgi:hypothetical protein